MTSEIWHFISALSRSLLTAMCVLLLYIHLFTKLQMALSKRLYLHGFIKLLTRRRLFVKYYLNLMIVELAMIKCLFKFPCDRDQYFELDLGSHGGHFTLFEACELQYPTQITALAQRAQHTFSDMARVLEAGLIIPRFTLRICYFDRKFCGADVMIWFWCSYDGNNLGPIQQEIEEGHADLEQPWFEQLAHLSRFPLQLGQYFTHFYRQGQDPDPDDADTLVFTQITDSFLPLLQKKQRKKLVAEIRTYIPPDSPYRRIAICYRPRYFNTLQYTFYYDSVCL